MGSLTPGAKYIYERVNDIVYQREAGSSPSSRKEIGRNYSLDSPVVYTTSSLE